MLESTSDTLGLIAGSGSLPCDIARSAAQRGARVAVIAFYGHTDARLHELADSITWVHPGAVEEALEALLASGARRAVMAGKVPKSILFGDGVAKFDALATRELAGLANLGDEAILGLVAEGLAKVGVELLSQLELVPELVGGVGVLGQISLSEAQQRDVDFAWPIAKTIATLDIGQTVVVKDRAILAVEAIDGTDAAIRRAGDYASGARVVKVARPQQDPRFDVPTIGPETLRVLIDARADALAFEAGRTVVLERESLIDIADRNNIALVGIKSDANAKEVA